MNSKSGHDCVNRVVVLRQDIPLLRINDNEKGLCFVMEGFARALSRIVLGPKQNMTLDGQPVIVSQVLNAGGVRFVSETALEKQLL